MAESEHERRADRIGRERAHRAIWCETTRDVPGPELQQIRG